MSNWYKIAKDVIPGGKFSDVPDSDFDSEQLQAGIKIELEHTNNKDIAKEIAKAHLDENKNYYKCLKKMESECEQ